MVPHLPGSGGFTHTYAKENGLPVATWFNAVLDLKVKRVCRECNSGWMQELDQRLAPLLIPMLNGHAVCFGPNEIVLMATWAAKIQALYQYAIRPPRAVPPPRLGAICKGRPSEGTFVWLASYSGKRSAWVSSRQLRFQRPSAPEDYQFGELFTLAIGHLVVQVLVGPNWPGTNFRPEVPTPASPLILPVWPGIDSGEWPPATQLSDEELDRYARSFVNDG
jgi:hypothetical protein